MRRILLDANVVLDVLLDRKPHVRASSAVWSAVESKLVEGLVAAHAVTTIHYFVRKDAGAGEATRIMKLLLSVFGVAAVHQGVIQRAIDLPSPDFEDAVTALAAETSNCELIVTRDPKGFRSSPVQAMTPEAAVPMLTRR